MFISIFEHKSQLRLISTNTGLVHLHIVELEIFQSESHKVRLN